MLICYSAVRNGKCDKMECPYEHDQHKVYQAQVEELERLKKVMSDNRSNPKSLTRPAKKPERDRNRREQFAHMARHDLGDIPEFQDTSSSDEGSTSSTISQFDPD